MWCQLARSSEGGNGFNCTGCIAEPRFGFAPSHQSHSAPAPTAHYADSASSSHSFWTSSQDLHTHHGGETIGTEWLKCILENAFLIIHNSGAGKVFSKMQNERRILDKSCKQNSVTDMSKMFLKLAAWHWEIHYGQWMQVLKWTRQCLSRNKAKRSHIQL